MTDLTGLARAISQLGADGFSAALYAWLKPEVSADNASILAYQADMPPQVLFSSVKDPHRIRHLNEFYASGIYRLDPFYALHQQDAAAGVYALNDIAPDQFNRNAYFLQFYKQSGMVDELAFVARPAPRVSVHFCLSRESRRFSSREHRRALPLAQTVVALMAQHWKDLRAQPQDSSDPGNLADQLRKTLAQQDGISLTPRQAQVATLILQGHSSASIALLLDVSPQTVKVFRKQLYSRCEISSQSELFSLCLPHLSALL
jgi:DNA-binding CsgD family transcriptional regulator